LLRAAREFEHNAQSESGLVTGEIELGCFITFAPLYLPRLLAGFRGRHPGVRVNVHEGWQTSLMEGLKGGRFDLAMMYDFDLDATFEWVELMCNVKPQAVLSKTHHLAKCETVSLRALVAEPFVLLDVPPSGEYFCGLFTALGLTPNVAYRSPTLELVRGLVGQGLGYSVLATRPASAMTNDGNEIVTVPLSDPVRHSVLTVAWARSVRCSPPAKAFIEHCKGVFQNIPLAP
jgi:DNA-binding transcriptional LysR family regulator